MVMDGKTKKYLVDLIAHQYQPEKGKTIDDNAVIGERLKSPIASGQLWGVDDHESSAKAVVMDVMEDRRIAQVIPVGDYEGGYDLRDCVIFPDGSPTGFPLIIYKDFGTTIPVRLLSIPFGSFDQPVMESLNAFEGEYDPDDDDTGAIVERLNIKDQFERWHALCAQLPKLPDTADNYRKSADIGDYVKALHDVLGFAPAQCLAVRRGTLKLDETQKKRMADAGFAASPNTIHSLPRKYMEIAEQPQWRPLVDDLINGHPDSAESAFMLETQTRDMLARESFALAARTNGHGDEAIIGLFEKVARDMARKRD